MKNLTSMTDFVLNRNTSEEVCREDFVKCAKYAKFLKQPLEIWQFVPAKLVDSVCVVLEEPKEPKYGSLADDWINEQYKTKVAEYQQAKSLCLFDGFKEIGNSCVSNSNIMIHFLNDKISIEEHFEGIITKVGKEFKTIEDLVKHNLKLTATAQKKLGL